MFGAEILNIGADVMPAENAITANSRLSWKAALAHEIEGHRLASVNGKNYI